MPGVARAPTFAPQRASDLLDDPAQVTILVSTPPSPLVLHHTSTSSDAGSHNGRTIFTRGAAMTLPPDAPQLNDLDLLLAVERRGSVGKAAREQGISQPAASLRIRTMERRLGIRLLERSSSGSKLTHEAAVIADWARRAVEAVEELLACKAALKKSSAEQLRVAGSLNTVEYLIPRWLGLLGVHLENTDIEIRAESTASIFEQVRDGKIDLGFVSGMQTQADLAERHIGYDELVVVVGPGHPWAERTTPLERRELADSRLVLQERGTGTRKFAEELMGSNSVRRSWVELPSTTAVKQAVASGSGAAILALSTVARELQDGRLSCVRVNGIRPTTPVRAVWSKARGLNHLGQQFLEVASRENAVPAGAARRQARRPTSNLSTPDRALASDHDRSRGTDELSQQDHSVARVGEHAPGVVATPPQVASLPPRVEQAEKVATRGL